jgi:mono/diheme cytochrome c family protein
MTAEGDTMDRTTFRRRATSTLFLGGSILAASASIACGPGGAPASSADGGGAVTGPTAIPPSAQPAGDPARGYSLLVNAGYISHGVPWSGFSATKTPLQPSDSLPGREGDNASVGYDFNVSVNREGMKIASPNCLACHATHMNGQLIVGLGRPNHALANASGTSIDVPGILLNLKSTAEIAEFETFGQRLLNLLATGELLAFATLASHRDPATLAWSNGTYFDASTGLRGWVDIPPWWRTRKQNGLFAQGMGRGVQSRHMSFMSVVSVQDTTEAAQIESWFVDIAAYIRSIEPPAFPGPVDAGLAARGEQVYAQTCAQCHGTYGAHGTYPNLLIPYDQVGTDPELAVRSWVNPAAQKWFSESYYAGDGASWLEPVAAYIAPPLDGIWATAPYFHNGSVPTLAALLDSTSRPATWSSAFGDADFGQAYDLQAVGWRNTPSVGETYDTSQPGSARTGHTYGDALPQDDRQALLEYLKTL